ncbi:MAG: ornithine carbamoyltransferase [Rhodospirillaceae bacterium]|nr:ornithine carbamoyltransferase [Rhodospirillaceae bacterium]|tara:strand:+ start:1082 stop:1987 length:906 start_codon:yes stop_codon:yes gene_type:complete
MAEPRHFLDIKPFDEATLREMFSLSKGFKDGTAANMRPLEGKFLALVFEKPSTRTRISFDVGMRQLGGETVHLTQNDAQLGQGETVADTARVLSRFVDIIMMRTTSPDKLHEMAEFATVPVINGLTDDTHPCQLMADVMTFEEHRGPIRDRVIAWSGDGNNMALSWIQAAVRFDFELRLACPPELSPNTDALAWAKKQGAKVQVIADPSVAVEGADCVVTDTWVSMNNSKSEFRHNLLRSYQVDGELMAKAKPDAIFMHCLPAHRGEEVTESIIDGPQSVVWDEAENRLHAQKGILAWCLS